MHTTIATIAAATAVVSSSFSFHSIQFFSLSVPLLVLFFLFRSHLFSLPKFKTMCMGTYFTEYIVSSSSHLSLLYYLSCIFLFWNEYASVPAHWELNHHWIRIARWVPPVMWRSFLSLNAIHGTELNSCLSISVLVVCVCVRVFLLLSTLTLDSLPLSIPTKTLHAIASA